MTTLFRYRWLILALALFGGVAGLVSSFVMRTMYVADVKTMPSEDTSNQLSGDLLEGLGALSGLALPGMGASSTMKYEALEILQSRRFLEEFISANDLLREIFASQWLEETESWKEGLFSQAPSLVDGAETFRDDLLDITEDRRTGVIGIAVTWPEPQRAADLANKLIGQLNKEMRDRAIQDATKNLEFLEAQVQTTGDVELRKTIYSLMEAEIKKTMLAEVREQYALRVISWALPPEEDDFEYPNRLLLLVGGSAAGFLLALAYVLYRQLEADSRTHDAQ